MKQTTAKKVLADSGLTQLAFSRQSGIPVDTLSSHSGKIPTGSKIPALFWKLARECQKKHPETFKKIILRHS